MGLLLLVVVVVFLFCLGGFLVGDDGDFLWFELLSNVDDDSICLILCKELKRKKNPDVSSLVLA